MLVSMASSLSVYVHLWGCRISSGPASRREAQGGEHGQAFGTRAIRAPEGDPRPHRVRRDGRHGLQGTRQHHGADSRLPADCVPLVGQLARTQQVRRLVPGARAGTAASLEGCARPALLRMAPAGGRTAARARVRGAGTKGGTSPPHRNRPTRRAAVLRRRPPLDERSQEARHQLLRQQRCSVWRGTCRARFARHPRPAAANGVSPECPRASPQHHQNRPRALGERPRTRAAPAGVPDPTNGNRTKRQ